jgi:hypothetical protein
MRTGKRVADREDAGVIYKSTSISWKRVENGLNIASVRVNTMRFRPLRRRFRPRRLPMGLETAAPCRICHSMLTRYEDAQSA